MRRKDPADIARKLVDKMQVAAGASSLMDTRNAARECALVAVDEIMLVCEGKWEEDTEFEYSEEYANWKQVKLLIQQSGRALFH